MSVTYGFYNSYNGDRKYDALQMSSIFDGIIVDGIFASIGTAFVVKATTGRTVNVGVGKAWFNHTWTLNDSVLPMEAPDSDLLYNRIDALVIEVNASDSVRENSIKFIEGEAATNPVRPVLANDELVHQYPLCYIYRPKGSVNITQADITNMVGTEEAPFVTGILQTVSLDQLLGQWQDQLDQFVENETKAFENWAEEQETSFKTWSTEQKNGFETWADNQEKQYAEWTADRKNQFYTWMSEQQTAFESFVADMKADLDTEQRLLDEWIASEQADFLAWYNEMKGQLSDDAAGNLQLQIDKEEIDRILLCGFVGGTKTVSEGGRRIESISQDGRGLTKLFSEDFSTLTTILYSSNGAPIAETTKRFEPDGSITTNATYYR